MGSSRNSDIAPPTLLASRKLGSSVDPGLYAGRSDKTQSTDEQSKQSLFTTKTVRESCVDSDEIVQRLEKAEKQRSSSITNEKRRKSWIETLFGAVERRESSVDAPCYDVGQSAASDRDSQNNRKRKYPFEVRQRQESSVDPEDVRAAGKSDPRPSSTSNESQYLGGSINISLKRESSVDPPQKSGETENISTILEVSLEVPKVQEERRKVSFAADS